MRLILAEWYRGTHRKAFWLAIAGTIAFVIQGLWVYGPQLTGLAIPPHYYNAYAGFVSAVGGGLSALYIGVLPLLAILPAGDSIAIDSASGYRNSVLVRVAWPQYVSSKLLSNMLLSASSTVVGLCLGFLASLIWYPAQLPTRLPEAAAKLHPPTNGVYPMNYQPHTLPHLFWTHPFAYVAVVVIFAAIASCALASIATLISLWVSHRYVVLGTPFILFWVANGIAGAMQLPSMMPIIFAGAYLGQFRVPWFEVVAFWIGIICVVVLVTLWVGRRDHEGWTVEEGVE